MDKDEGRDEAFGLFYRKSFAPLVGRCIRIGVPEADAPGIVQDLMLEVYGRWSSIECPEAYTNSVVAYRAVDFLKISSRAFSMDESDLDKLGKPLVGCLHDGTPAVDEEHLVLQALAQLPPEQRAVFALNYDGFSNTDIAAILDRKDGTVRSNLRHAKGTLSAWWDRINPPQSKEGGA